MGGRSAWKLPFVHPHIIKAIARLRKAGKKRGDIKTYSGASTIIPDMVGYRFHVHNGREFQLVEPSRDLIGHKLGEFVRTRKRAVHQKK